MRIYDALFSLLSLCKERSKETGAAFLADLPTACCLNEKNSRFALKQLFVFNGNFAGKVPGCETNARELAHAAAFASEAGYPLDEDGVKNGMLFERSEFIPFSRRVCNGSPGSVAAKAFLHPFFA